MGQSIDWIESKNKIVIDAYYSELMHRKFVDQAIYFDRNIRKYTKSFQDEDLSFYLGLGKSFSRKDGFLKLLSLKKPMIEAISCHELTSASGIEAPLTQRPLLEHQLIALKFIRSNQGSCILGDEGGVGKTYPPLVYAYEKGLKTLILCPEGLVENWRNEIRALFFENDLIGSLFEVVGFDSHKQIDEKVNGTHYLIIDEAHHASDLKSKRTSKILSISKNLPVTLLTGNSIKYWALEFYSMLKILKKDITKDRYLKRFFNYTIENKRPLIIGLKASKLKYYIAPFYLRRKLDDVSNDLKGENAVHRIKLSSSEMETYKTAVKSRGALLSGGAVIAINKTLSLLKVPYLAKHIKQQLKEDPKRKIVICSQFKECFTELQKDLPFITLYPGSGQIMFLDTSIYKEGFSLNDYSRFIMLDVFANKLHNLQIKRRFLRLGQSSNSVLCTYFLAGLLDQEMLMMPDILSYQKSVEFFDRYFRKAA